MTNRPPSLYKHSVSVTEDVWKWMQKESGLKNPAPYARNLLYSIMYSRLEGATPINVGYPDTSEAEHIFESLDVGYDPVDAVLNKARERWIAAFDNDDLRAANRLQDHVARGINDPRAFLISWAAKMEEK